MSGATMTSGAIKQAAAQAIAQAMGEEAAPEGPVHEARGPIRRRRWVLTTG